MTLTVIVNADDFGLTQGVNESILACHLAGSVTSTSFMANMDAAEHAAILARGNPTLGVGLHFNLTLGRPLSPRASVPSLVGDAGDFLPRRDLLRRWALNRIDSQEIQVELLAQLARMRQLGLEPTHFDSHQHVHSIPQVFRSVAELASAEGKAVRVTWKWAGRAGGKTLVRRATETSLGVMTSRCVARKPASLRTNTGLCSVFDLPMLPEQIDAACYEQLLAPYASGVVELMVHPAVVDAELASKTAITRVSAVEDRLLRTDAVQRIVAGRGASLGTYADA